jgi:hypothetical protein
MKRTENCGKIFLKYLTRNDKDFIAKNTLENYDKDTDRKSRNVVDIL